MHIGHNNGPPIDGPDPEPDPAGLRLRAWKKAHRAAFRAPSIDALQRRTRRANEMGLTYTQFTAVVLDRGRNPTTLFFGLGGVLARLTGGAIKTDERGAPLLMPGVKAKLAAIGPGASFVIENADSADKRDAFLAHIRAIAAACGHAFTGARVSAGENDLQLPSPALPQALLAEHGLQPGEAVMVGDSVAHEKAAERAGLGLFVWAYRYFAEKPQPSA